MRNALSCNAAIPQSGIAEKGHFYWGLLSPASFPPRRATPIGPLDKRNGPDAGEALRPFKGWQAGGRPRHGSQKSG
jgi:hypothetical protein